MAQPPSIAPQSGQLHIAYIRLDYARRWSNNHKKHDLEKIAESIQRYGFRNAPVWDEKLNNGVGGIAGGNGSTEALELLFSRNPDQVPKHIGMDEHGNWYFPVQFGGDSESQAAAEAFAVDLNNLTLAGFSAEEKHRLWESDKYLAIAKRLQKENQLPVSIAPDDVTRLLSLAKPIQPDGAYATSSSAPPSETDADGDGDGKRSPREVPKGTRLTFYVEDPDLVNQAIAQTGQSAGEAVETICSAYLMANP
jgi:hypothetical protein